MSQFLAARTGPYMHSPGHRWTKCFRQPGGRGTRTFTILIASAFNAGGYLVPQNNGVVVLDEDNRTVVIDQVERSVAGGLAPTRAQEFVAHLLRCAQWGDFVALIIALPNYLVCLESGPIAYVRGARRDVLLLA